MPFCLKTQYFLCVLPTVHTKAIENRAFYRKERRFSKTLSKKENLESVGLSVWCGRQKRSFPKMLKWKLITQSLVESREPLKHAHKKTKRSENSPRTQTHLSRPFFHYLKWTQSLIFFSVFETPKTEDFLNALLFIYSLISVYTGTSGLALK